MKAHGILVFPSVIKAGVRHWRGEYGEGRAESRTGEIAGYYNLVSASFGFQLGVQARTLIMMFMTEGRRSGASGAHPPAGKVGVDGSVAVVITLGAGGAIDTETLTEPGDRLHHRSARADVQSQPRGFEDQQDRALRFGTALKQRSGR